MIARGNQGQAYDMREFDAAEIANDVGELYEPLATKVSRSAVEASEAAPVKGNRELVSQALANLVGR